MHNTSRDWLYVLLVLVFCACGSSGDEDSEEQAAEDNAGSVASGDSPDRTGSGGTGVADAPVTCGDGKVDNLEECDDGNTDDTDGCTSLCEYSCHSDADCQEDECRGAGSMCDTETHACTVGTGDKPDGEPCGANGSCRKGVCVERECNNGFKEPGEECDDGDDIENNGCTTDCKFSCATGDDEYAKCANDCDLTATCDDATHACVAGNPAPDNEICANGGGYCSNGLCVLSDCGDGVQQPNEECDQGEDNGVPNSGCTATCTLSVCGDGIIDGKEHCDDGNVTNLDGCDSNCKIELVYRATLFQPTMDDPPDFCVYRTNTFGALMNDTSLIGGMSDMMNDMMETSPIAFIFHILGVDDPSGTTPDPLVRIGAATGDPDPNGVGGDGLDWANTSERLDFPMLVYREFYDEKLNPVFNAYADITVENGVSVIQSATPVTMGFDIKGGTFDYQGMETDVPTGKFIMRDLMLRLEIDPVRSKIPAPPETTDIEVPESAGNYDPTHTTESTGILCGAIDSDIFEQIGIPSLDITGGMGIMFDPTVLCTDQWGQIIACQPGQSPTNGECSSMLDFMKLGCSSPLGVVMEPLGPPDADTDGDGEPDAYTIVTRIATQRITLSGYSEKEPLGYPVVE